MAIRSAAMCGMGFGLRHLRIIVLLVAAQLGLGPTASATEAQIEGFSPQGEVKGVRQVTARFSDSMVPFGDPRQLDPFDINCPESGSGRWVDDRNWAFDFDRDLPAGVRCRFSPKKNLVTLAGRAVSTKTAFEFNTGGPAIRHSLPREGESWIDQEQAFILGLDAPATMNSVITQAYCTAEGIGERIPVSVVTGEDRRQVLEARRNYLVSWYSAVLKHRGRSLEIVLGIDSKGSDEARFLQLRDGDKSPLMVVRCQRTLPPDAEVRLVWDAGISTQSGIATSASQELAFKTRKPFEASFSCERAHKQGQCIPLLPMTLNFTAPIAVAYAERIRLVSAKGKTWSPKLPDEDKRSESVPAIRFAGPFPEKAQFRIEIPKDLADDSGRPLKNQANFPLAVQTDENPPLAKFSAWFGIIEANAYSDGSAALPLTIRNIERTLPGMAVSLADTAQLDGKSLSVTPEKEIDVVRWLRRLKEANEDVYRYNRNTGREEISTHSGAASLFSDKDRAATFAIKKPLARKTMEVVGIPLKRGFHVVEISSPRLGAALLDDKRPYFAHAAALVTNLSVHFKQGRESSLVWVTSLDKGTPAAGAVVTVWDCGAGTRLWSGRTNSLGIARIETPLPRQPQNGCLGRYDRQFFVTARLNEDFSFALSGWNGGISSWRFNLPGGMRDTGSIVHAVLDRTLFRAGETAHLKLVARQPLRAGFAIPPAGTLAEKLTVRHTGTDQTWERPLTWDGAMSAVAEFEIPKGAKQGTYALEVEQRHRGSGQTLQVGSFRVESFRIPTLRTRIAGAGKPEINPREVVADAQIDYLSGGGAGGLAVKFRSLLQARSVRFAGYEEFAFANGGVKEGIVKSGGEWDDEGDFAEDGEDADSVRSETPAKEGAVFQTRDLALDGSGGGRVRFDKLPRIDKPMDMVIEAEYRDPNGETLASGSRVPLWPSGVVLGIKSDSWLASKDLVRFQLAVLDTAGKPLAGIDVKSEFFQRVQFSHRRRLIGGFYAYEHGTELKRIEGSCVNRSDERGLAICEIKPPAGGNLVILASAADRDGNPATAHADVWVPGENNWFAVEDNDRIDLIPEKRRYEPGETARFQVRMPFRQATALVTVEREGVMEAYVRSLSRDNPVIEVPIKGNYSPNVYVSAFVVRGRVAAPAPTALVDLAKPAYKMGLAMIEVGRRAYELNVAVKADKPVYRIREKAEVLVRVARADGKPLPRGTEVAIAAVDEGLLELKPNDSWQLLEAMLRRRGLEVETSTAQMQVIGKRHFGRKALPAGGGGGRQSGRELFDTLLSWQPRIVLDENGEARISVPLNDSLSSFRIVAVALGGAASFGTGHASIRTTQELILSSGLPQLVRELDSYRALFVVRNTSDRAIEATVTANVTASGSSTALPAQRVQLGAGEGTEVSWEVKAPLGATQARWDVAVAGGEVSDRVKLTQKVVPAVPVRTFQATIRQLAGRIDLPARIPEGALPGRGGIQVSLKARLGDSLSGVTEYMGTYPYTCMEQRASVAIALNDSARWASVMTDLPSHLDRDGLVKYFPLLDEGSDVLTTYLLSVSQAARFELPEQARARMEQGLVAFIEGKVVRRSSLPTADVAIRKVAALDALARGKTRIEARWLDSISVQPNLWPTSAVLDWYSLLRHVPSLPNSAKRLAEAEQIVRSRLNFQGTTMGFSTERNDALWWLMVSGDVNANRLLELMLTNPAWREDIPRLVIGALGRQQHGHWNTTVANAWGAIAMRGFSAAFESEPVTGRTRAAMGTATYAADWGPSPSGGDALLPWTAQSAPVSVVHTGTGKPWLTTRSLAALPLDSPLSTGYRIVRQVTPVQQKEKGAWHRGDVVRVRLDLEAQSDMTWVVVDDPIPSGATVLGTGLGGDSKILTRGEKREGWVWPAYEERTHSAFRAYYRFVPKGKWTVEYTLRLNNPGEFSLPATRVEAMYAPEMFAELPNAKVQVRP